MANKRMTIELIIRDGKMIELTKNHKRKFHSYARVARALNTGDIATVKVESKSGKFWFIDGFGDVERTDLQSYRCPKRLMPGY